MIIINRERFDPSPLLGEYAAGSLERLTLERISASQMTYAYDNLNQLRFELRMRREIVNAAIALNGTRLSFTVFQHSRCNPEYWVRMPDGGFALRNDVKPSDAIRDIFLQSSLYGTECATAMVIVYYKALLEIFPEDAFNKTFTEIHLMNWQRIERQLREIGRIRQSSTYLPGDRRYVANPDVNPLTPELQGENVIDLGDGRFYGHGFGIHTVDVFIAGLNANRRPGAERSAYLMDTVSFPNFRILSDLYDQNT
jgi:protein-glutamine gamma-glutamyltransferase